MKNFTRWILLASIAVAVSAVVFNFGPVASSQSSRKGERSKVNPNTSNRPGLENFDIRVRRADEAEAAVAPAPKQKGGTPLAIDAQKQMVATQSQREAAAVVQQSMRAAEQQLAARVPNLKVDYNEALRAPEIVKVDGAGVLASGAKGSNEATLRGFVSDNAALYGLTRGQAAQLSKFSDYTNPAGNLAFVELEQQINGIPVFQGYVRGVLTPEGQLVRTVSLLAPGMRTTALSTSPGLNPAEAVAAGIKHINLKVDGSLNVLDTAADGRTHLVSRGPLDEETKTTLMYFPVVPGHAVLAYAMTLWQPVHSYYVFVDANTGQLLWRKNITQDQQTPYTYNIYNNDSPTPSAPVRSSLISPTNTTSTEPQPPGISRTDLTLISESPFDNLGWIPDSAGPSAPTTGNNVDAGLDIAAPNGIDAGGRATATNFVFRFDYRPDGSTDPVGSNNPADPAFRMGAVTNLFFWSNRYHDQVYHLGFTEAARNFQTDNFGRGGLGGDAVRAEAQDSSNVNNANFNTPADGQPPRMQMFIFTGTPNRDGDLDQEVVYHELTHGTSNRLHANGSGLSGERSQGMGEGWSDFYAISLLATLTPDGDDGKRLYAMGAYDTRNYYRAIRRFPYAVKSAVAANGRSHNPLTLADIDPAQINVSDAAFPVNPGQANQVHNQGEVWCSSLIEVRAKMIEKYGFAAGSQRVLLNVTDGMKLDPINPSQLDGRDSILAANCAGFGGFDELDIWDAFRIRGAGFLASVSGLTVKESFQSVNLRLETVTAAEVAGSGNGNGVIDPGETVRLTIPLTNILCAHNADNTTVTITPGGGVANYGSVEPGNTESQTIDYTVPVGTACGAAIPVTITVNNSLGTINYTYFLNIGQPSALQPFEYFDGVTAPALPPGWTTERTGAGMPWTTSTVNSDTPPNNAFTPNPTNPGTSELISPTFPVNTGLARLSFRNLYNLEDNFDGMNLLIKIGNGAFQDIIAAGGSFVSGGYNGETNAGAAWTGLSAGTTASPAYITTVVNLPPQANGQNVQLKWRVFGDPNTIAPGQAGARIDTIQLSTTADNCTPFGVNNVSISGRVTGSNGVGLGGIQVTLSGSTNATRTTAADGSYSFVNLVQGGNYTVAPTTPNYDYTPPSRTYNNLQFDVTDANFTAIPSASISGRVTTENGAQGIDGITITLTGTESRQTVTSGGGYYSFLNLTRGGNYTVTPSGGQNNTFTPPSRTYNNLQGPVTDANFVAMENIACNAIGSPVNGQIAAGDPTQSQRVFRGGTPSDCAGRPFPGYNADPAPVQRRYDQYTYVNSSANSICVKVTVRADNAGIHSVAYLGAFNPADVGQNYLGDLGAAYAANTEASYSFTVPAGATYVIVIHEITPNTPATINYTFVQCSTPNAPAPTPTPKLAAPGDVLITEFRQSVGSTTSSDEYIEFYNNTDATISINGYAVAIHNPAFGGDVFLGLPAGTTIPRRGHLIVANVAAGGYSLSPYAAPDLSHANANLMPDNQGFGLIDPSRTVMIDSVGFRGNGGNLPYIEGNGLTPTANGTTPLARPNVQHAYVRRINAATSFPQDTGDNANDFQLVSVTAAVFNTSAANGGPIQSILGAPGPENRTSPVERSAYAQPQLIDPMAPAGGGENRRRLGCGAPNTPPCNANTSSFGWLSIRRKVTNTSGASLTRLRFRIVDITTLGSPGGGPASTQADLRAVSSTQMVVTINGTPTTVEGTTLEQPATTPPMDGGLGGGLNNSLSVGSITLATPLLNGQTVNVQFLLGVQKEGSFRFAVNVEALP
jgi:hypothetical protein